MSRRGISSTEREWNAPWARLRVHLADRYAFGADVARRWERPDPESGRSLPALLRQASAAIDADVVRMARALDQPLTATEVDVLLRLSVKPSAGVNLGEYLRLPPVTVTRVLRRLADKGLVRREEHAMDLRLRVAHLTPRGVDLVRRLAPRLDDLADQWIEELDDEGEEATAVLVRLIAVLADIT